MEPTDWESDVSGDSIDFIDEFCNDDLPESIRPLLGDPYFLQELCALPPFWQLGDAIGDNEKDGWLGDLKATFLRMARTCPSNSSVSSNDIATAILDSLYSCRGLLTNLPAFNALSARKKSMMRAQVIAELDDLVPGWQCGTDTIRSGTAAEAKTIAHSARPVGGGLASPTVTTPRVSSNGLYSGTVIAAANANFVMVDEIAGPVVAGSATAGREQAAKEAAQRTKAAKAAARRENAAKEAACRNQSSQETARRNKAAKETARQEKAAKGAACRKQAALEAERRENPAKAAACWRQPSQEAARRATIVQDAGRGTYVVL